MAKLSKLLASTGLALLLASCGSDADGTPATDTTAGADMAMNDPTNPFAQSEMTMNERMMMATGADVSDTWLKQMIEHHRGAIAMSEVVLTQTPTPEALAMAQDTIAKQGKEIEDLTKLLSKSSANPANPANLEPYRPANMAMHEAMMAAKGADVSETYLRKMLAHHRGAVALSDVVLANGATGRVRTAAQKVKSDQTKEGAMIEAMLAREPMPMASSAPEPGARRADPAPAAKPSASTPTPEKAAAPAKPTTLKPAPTPIATPTTDPHAGMKM